MAEVSYICKRTVVSTKVMQQGKFCPLSVFDRVMENNHLLLVLYYQSPPGLKVGALTAKLRESVANVLCAYPIITGRLLKTTEGHWMIKCNDAGMRLVEATAKGSMDEWLQNVNREKELQLIHWEPIFHRRYFWSTFYVQLTEFEGGGLAIGLSCSHLLADPTCATMFIKAWADTTLFGKMITPPLFHPLPTPRPLERSTNCKPYTALIDHYKNTIEKPPQVSSVKHTTISLKFDDNAVRSCIAKAIDTDASFCREPTPFQALAGLFWICISKVKGRQNGLIDMSLSLDTRKVLRLEKSFFGNCTVHNKVQGHGISVSEFSKAVTAIKGVEDEMDNDRVLELIEWLKRFDYEHPPWMLSDGLICANMEGVESYSAIFEAVYKPIHASYYIEPALGEGQVLIIPSPSSEEESLRRVVMVTLHEDELDKLLGLELIQQLSPAILMGLNNQN
ncbi:acetyltransferase [Lithospermum erythrorhizon]|uniref:Acetyltransferase n=1 Tax=Lithospermum erythrorhizon TaxID=34254 RepID=A0AAV3PAU5_LITER